MLAKSAAGHFRRFKGYDYSRGGSIFITATLAERRPLFGCVAHDRVELSDAGAILAAQIERVKGEFPLLEVRALVIMPDHLHLRLTFPSGLAAPVVDIGNFIGRIKQYSQHYIKAAGQPVIRAVPDPLAMVYRPKGDEPALFDQRRLLLLSRQVAAEDRYTAWHGINSALGEMALAKGGSSLYVRPGAAGRLEWRWRTATP